MPLQPLNRVGRLHGLQIGSGQCSAQQPVRDATAGALFGDGDALDRLGQRIVEVVSRGVLHRVDVVCATVRRNYIRASR